MSIILYDSFKNSLSCGDVVEKKYPWSAAILPLLWVGGKCPWCCTGGVGRGHTEASSGRGIWHPCVNSSKMGCGVAWRVAQGVCV